MSAVLGKSVAVVLLPVDLTGRQHEGGPLGCSCLAEWADSVGQLRPRALATYIWRIVAKGSSGLDLLLLAFDRRRQKLEGKARA
jgi:hypothetical protein